MSAEQTSRKRYELAVTAQSNLTFDIHSGKGCSSRRLEESNRFSGEKSNRILALYEQVLATMVQDKLGGIRIGLEAEFLRDESQRNIWLVSRGIGQQRRLSSDEGMENLRPANVAQSSQSLSSDEHIHQICTHVRGVEVELEKSVIVAQCKRRADIKRMLDGSL